MSLRSLATLSALAVCACSQGAMEQSHDPDSGPIDGTDAGPADAGPPDAGPPDAGPDGGGSPTAVEIENQHSGDPKWNVFTINNSHFTEAYADRVSASAGDRFQVMASSSRSVGAQWRLYRIGWYRGAGARLVSAGSHVALSTQAPCPADRTTGLVRCTWAPTFSVDIPTTAISGLYAVTIVRDDGYGTFVPIVIRDTRKAALVFQSSVPTYQAYNSWGGESLYTDSIGIAGAKALMVSFDRPYLSGHGAGDLFVAEAAMAKFLERYGYDVTYTTNLDVVRVGLDEVRRAKAFLSVGHDEYWPGAERDLMEQARDQGTSLVFLGANPAYWKIRTSDPGPDGNPRTITCYKQFPQRDPLAGTPEATGRFRDPPFNRPEDELVGAMYESFLLFPQPWVVNNADTFLTAGTGLRVGDAIPLLVGWEYDRTFADSTPGPVTVIGRSPLVDAEGRPSYAESTAYFAPSGAFVFASATIYWSPMTATDERVARMTANVLEAAAAVPVPPGLESPTAPQQQAPIAAWARSVGTVATGLTAPTSVVKLQDGSLLVSDPRAQKIFRIVDGMVTTFAGDGNPGGDPRFDNCAALRARFFQPTALAVDSTGVVYVADTENSAIRAILNDSQHTVVTFAGVMGAGGFADGVGSAARFDEPTAIFYDAPRARLLVADTANQRIRGIDIATARVTTVAGAGPGDEQDGPALIARFDAPTAVVAAADGRVFFVASGTTNGLVGSQMKMMRTDAAHTVVSLTTGGFGFADGSGSVARLLPQSGLAWDGQGLYVSDPGNYRIRRLVPGTDDDDTRVVTVAGTGRPGTADGSGDVASFTLPLGMQLQSDGTLLVADGTGSVRSITP
jgi:NHL repeat